VWLSAALGMGAGGRLYIVSSYAVVLVILVLRIGPRMAGVYIKPGGNRINSTSCYDSDAWDTDSENNGVVVREENPGKTVSREEQIWLLEREIGSSSSENQQQKEEGFAEASVKKSKSQSNEYICEVGLPVDGMETPIVDNSAAATRRRRLNRASSHPGFSVEDDGPGQPPKIKRSQSETVFEVPLKVQVTPRRRSSRYSSPRKKFGSILVD